MELGQAFANIIAVALEHMAVESQEHAAVDMVVPNIA